MIVTKYDSMIKKYSHTLQTNRTPTVTIQQEKYKAKHPAPPLHQDERKTRRTQRTGQQNKAQTQNPHKQREQQ